MALQGQLRRASTGREPQWCAAYAQHVEPAQVIEESPSPDAFAGEVVTNELGPLRIVRLKCGPCTVHRSERNIGHHSSRTFTFLLQIKGEASFAHVGRQIVLRQGDFTLCDNSAPYALKFKEPSELIMLRVPFAMAKAHLPSPGYFCGHLLEANRSLASTAAAMAVSLARQVDEGLDSNSRERAARHLLDVIASCYVEAFDGPISTSSIATALQCKVKLYIEQHLRDPELSPSGVASQLKISSRYLRAIFAASSESPSAYILRRRLEESARQLADPAWRGHSITEIAFAWGFVSASHFTRSFREQFGTSPRDYRLRHLSQDTTALSTPGKRRNAPALTIA